MLLALLSDTHDNAANTLTALALLRSHRPAAWLHAGDLVAPDMLEHFAGLDPFHFVFGNNEYDHAALRSKALALSLHCHGEFADLTLAGKRVGLLHGHDGALLHKLVRAGNHDYLIHGHTHVRHDTRHGTTRVINPGALHRAKTKSAALLNLATDHLQFLELPTHP
jgi:putative phosphoesterase